MMKNTRTDCIEYLFFFFGLSNLEFYDNKLIIFFFFKGLTLKNMVKLKINNNNNKTKRTKENQERHA